MEDTLSNTQTGVTPDPNSQKDENEIKYFSKENPNPVSEDLDDRWLRWKCLVCGYVYEGASQLKVCPKCGNADLDKFDDVE